MARLIDAEPIKKFIVDGLNNPDLKKAFGHDAIEILTEIEYAPTVDAVHIGVLDQVRWERDVAIKQLEEHGIPFGGIAPDVLKVIRCKDCKHYNVYRLECHNSHMNGVIGIDGFCSYGERKDND